MGVTKDTTYAEGVIYDLLRRIQRELSAMPYGDAAHFFFPSPVTQPGEVMSLADVCDNLNKLRNVLAGIAEENQAVVQERDRLRNDIEAVRRIFAFGVSETDKQAYIARTTRASLDQAYEDHDLPIDQEGAR